MYKLAFFISLQLFQMQFWAAIQMPLKLKLKKSAANGCATGETGVVEENISSIKL